MPAYPPIRIVVFGPSVTGSERAARLREMGFSVRLVSSTTELEAIMDLNGVRFLMVTDTGWMDKPAIWHLLVAHPEIHIIPPPHDTCYRAS
jgi:hypothetical protein